MPDLSLASVQDWLNQHAPDFAALLDARAEDTESEGETGKAIVSLGEAFDRFRARHPQDLAEVLRRDPDRDHLRLVLAHLDPVRRIRLLDWLSDPDLPGSERLIRALAEPDETGAGQAIRDTIKVLRQQDILTRIFHPDRVKALLAACQSVPETE